MLTAGVDPPNQRELFGNLRHLELVGINSVRRLGGSDASIVERSIAGSAVTIAHGRMTTSGWYAGYVPASATSKPIVVIVSIPSGAFGAVSAAPVARQIVSQWFDGSPGPYRPGSSTAR